MNPAVYDTTLLIRIFDEDVGTGTPTPFSPERRYVVRPSMVDPESQLAEGSGIMDRDSIQGAVATNLLPLTLTILQYVVKQRSSLRFPLVIRAEAGTP